MVTKIVQEWEVTVSICRTITFPVEDGETKEEMEKWVRSDDGRSCIVPYFTKQLSMSGYSRNADLDFVEVNLRETEVKSMDTDPRV